ncbi:hypothetical protein ACRQ5D_29620 [Mucilaginibacter sp. P25]|uniref:hypothetical protein n=1 Tax=Mucilaginibacter sp. P25 TaxID=3423945 RepID=UPI003D79D886
MVTLDFDSFFGEDNIQEKERLLKKITSGTLESIEGHGPNTVALLENGKPVVKKIVSLHNNILGEKIKFELFEESEGTLRLLDFIPALFLIINYDVTVFIDENRSKHSSIIVERIYKENSFNFR